MEFPYTEQDPTKLKPDAWHLTQIGLPTGGTINIEYESDDYAYVEDKPVMEMFDLVSAGDANNNNYHNTNHIPTQTTSWDASTVYPSNNFTDPRYYVNGSNPYHGNLANAAHTDNEYVVYFPLKQAVPVGIGGSGGTGGTYIQDKDWFFEHYLKGVEHIYFNARIDLLGGLLAPPGGSIKRSEDFVKGYAKLAAGVLNKSNKNLYGVARSSSSTANYDLGYVTLAPAKIKAFGALNAEVHPFRKAAFQHLKNSRSDLIYGTSAEEPLNLFPYLDDLLQMAMGAEFFYKTKGYCKQIRFSGHSVIRLLTPDGKKYGGGSRVKEVSINDNWDNISGAGSSATSAEYGQRYEYTTTNERGEVISSGVAYEPHPGREQSALIQPIIYEYSEPLHAKQTMFLETPIMQEHYPGASVGYSKVTVKSINTDEYIKETVPADRKSTPTPISIHEFYTAKDFPIEFKYTKPDRMGPNMYAFVIPAMYTDFEKNMGASQGYTIILNDMHGKPRSIESRTISDVLISRQVFNYNLDAQGKLENTVHVMSSDGAYVPGEVGVDYDIIVEMNENRDESGGKLQWNLNLEGGVLPPPFSFIPIPIPIPQGVTKMKTSLKTAVVQKIIHKKGILKSTTITDGTSEITTENLVFDVSR